MKKISLKSVKEYLSRDEMRAISGGSGGGGSSVSCRCTEDPTREVFRLPNCSLCQQVCTFAGQGFICVG